MSDVHVVPHGNTWALEVAGDKQKSFDIQDEAIRRGRELAKHEHGELVIHGQGRTGSARRTRTGTYPPTVPG
jgi:hypothetical protein